MKSETVQTRTTGIAMGESPRWHEGRLWFSDWGLGRVLALDLKGNVEIARWTLAHRCGPEK
jgi:sugar lactone lactonase YvrE